MTDLHSRLDQLPALYTAGWELLEDCYPGTPTGNGGRTGKPTSRPPTGRDTQLRGLLVTAARHIDDALDHLHTHNPPTRRPAPFDTIGWVTRHHGHTDEAHAWQHGRTIRLAIRPSLAVWEPDPTDLSCEPPTPGQYRRHILAIEAVVAWAYTADIDLTVTDDLTRRAHDTLRTLTETGLPMSERCIVCGWQKRDGRHLRCEPCRKCPHCKGRGHLPNPDHPDSETIPCPNHDRRTA